MSDEQTVSERVRRPWETVSVQRWQLDRLMDGLGQIQATLDGAQLGDRMSVASATGFASGSAAALMMLVQSMKGEI